ncbi:uncharacterized protein AdoR isoform X4 [Panulirus ornatus]|uniref:uncharacterized protein AdoR isoform X4 n=1 Tax=Panulirus ornatus TaxID=150431 RepID=UPI003A8AA153
MMSDLDVVTVLNNHSDFEGITAELLATPTAGEGLNNTDVYPLSVPYAVSEVLVAVVAIIGNALTITVFVVDRKLRRLTNYYIVSLALADLLVGVLGIPFAILTSIGLPRLLWPCLLMLSTLLMLCTISIFCLVAVSVDRYWAILHPLRYSRVMTAKIVRRIILACWVVGTLIGLMPSMGWYRYHDSCIFTKVMNYDYLVFLYFCTIVVPGLLMAFFYTHIYTVVLKQLRQIAAQEPQGDNASLGTQSSQRQRSAIFRSQSRGQVSEGSSTRDDPRRGSTNTNIVHQVTHASRREVKAAKSLSIIVLFFMISWFPLYTINCIQAFCTNCRVSEGLMFFTILLSHLNSAINPFLYAYHMKDFRNALKMFIWHRILRRPVELDCAYGRSLVSPHHSTVYRVNMTGSPHLTHLHTPHALDTTPMNDSPTPLHATPQENFRSKPSTVGSHGPWYPSRGISPSLSFPTSPALPTLTSDDDQHSTSSSSRPRAATITTHTSPASARTCMTTTGSPSQLLPPSVVSDVSLQQPHFTTKRRAMTLPPSSPSHSLILTVPTPHTFPDSSSASANNPNPHNVTVTVDINQNTSDITGAQSVSPHTTVTCDVIQQAELTDNDASSRPVSGTWYVTARTSSTYSTHTGSSSLTNSEHEYDSKGVQESFPSKESIRTSTSNKISSLNESLQNKRTSSEDGVCTWSTTTICQGNEEKVEQLGSRKLMDKEEKDEIESREVDKSGCGEAVVEGIKHISQRIPNGSVWESLENSSDTNDSKPKSEEYTSECDKPDFPCLGIASGEPGSGTCCEDDINLRVSDGRATEQRNLLRGIGKYFPQIPRKESGPRSKNVRKTKNWWSEMIRHRSYHGVSLGLKGSKYKKRAQSVSGAIET